MKILISRLFILAIAISPRATADEIRLPPFLPPYYAPAFQNGSNPLSLVIQSKTNGIPQYFYSTSNGNLTISIENIECEKPSCDAFYNKGLSYLNMLITSNKGSFIEVTESEVHAEVIATNTAQTIFNFTLPGSVQLWVVTTSTTNREEFATDFQTLRNWVNRQRYEEALQAGNVSMGHYQKSIFNYAQALLKSGQKEPALVVLQNLLATSPFDYEAHLEFMNNTPDASSASNSANIVFKNAEIKDQIKQASRFLGIEPKSFGSIPYLEPNETGLQVILIPLHPCNPWLLDEVAKSYEQMTDIPVKVRQLNEQWYWGIPERISGQRNIQSLLTRFTQHPLDFTGWTKDQYTEALRKAVESEDVFSKYLIHDLIGKLNKDPGQYLADPYLNRLCGALNLYRSNDKRTMYVAITEANIYSGDNNFVFSVGHTGPPSPASLMSYHMMLGKTLNEAYDSRPRLIERISKELVPASLKQLNIPRSTDPTCPYSYSSGVERLDQKTLNLSDQVQQALTKFKGTTSELLDP